MAKHEDFLKQVRERAEKATAEWARHPMIDETTTLKEVVPFMLQTINAAVPVVEDVPKLLAIIEKLKSQRNRWICATTITSAEWLADKDDKELDEIVGQG